MLVRIYEITWIVIAVAAILALASGSMTPVVLVGFGFVVFGMVFMGMMGVLPSIYAHANHHDEPAPLKKEVKSARESAAGFHTNPLATR